MILSDDTDREEEEKKDFFCVSLFLIGYDANREERNDPN